MPDNANALTTPEHHAPTVPPGAGAILQASIRAALDDPQRCQFVTDRQNPMMSGADHANRG